MPSYRGLPMLGQLHTLALGRSLDPTREASGGAVIVSKRDGLVYERSETVQKNLVAKDVLYLDFLARAAENVVQHHDAEVMASVEILQQCVLPRPS